MRVLSLALIALGAAVAQQDATKPTFDVASVKPSPRESGRDLLNINLGTARHGTVTLGNTTLSECIRYAYGLSSEDQISGPDWIRDRNLRVDITAKAPPETALDQLLLMTQRLLAERFLLTIHHEQKAVPHGELVVVGNGPKRCDSQEEGPSTLKVFGRGHLAYDHLPMRMLAVLLSRQLRQTVLDRTGLPGYYNIDLQWTPDDLQPTPALRKADGAEAREAADVQEQPDIFRALQQQLGLKLERSKAPIDVLAIDHAEKAPAGN
jgi:uncharacterized protein (TIGR03435 family)